MPETQTSKLPATVGAGKAESGNADAGNTVAKHDASTPASPLQTELGNTTIAETVVTKIAGLAAREVPGVYAMGNAARRVINQLTDRVSGAQTSASGGVTVEQGDRQAAVDVTIVVDYGTSIVDVANAIRRNVIDSVEYSTGLEVVEVNVNVSDVHLPDDDAPSEDETGRVE